MKTILLALFIGTLVATAAVLQPQYITNANVIPGPFGVPDAPTNAVKVLPHTDTVTAPPTNWSLLIAVAVPAIIAGLKSWIPKMPTWMLPVLAPILGAALDLVMQLSGSPTSGVVNSALLGSAGVGLRELQDQLKQRTVKPPLEPPVVAVPPKTP